MRIGLVGHGHHPLVEPYGGGLEAFTVRLVRGLRERGHHVRLYAAAGTPGDVADEVVPFERSPIGLGREHLPPVRPGAPDPVDGPETRAYLGVVADLLRREVDVVANHSLQPTVLANSAAFSAPTVTTFHTPLLPPVHAASLLADHRARFTAVSGPTAAEWEPIGRPVRVIENGVDTTVFTPGPGGPRAVWSGRITPEKGTDVAIRAARAAGIGLDVVGPVADAPWFAAHVEPLLGDDVRHLGVLDQAALARVVGEAAVALVTPQWEEPFGLVAAEALACGTPVAALHRGALPGLVGPVGAIARTIEELPDAIDRARRIDRADVAAYARRRFDVEHMVDAYEALYAGVARA